MGILNYIKHILGKTEITKITTIYNITLTVDTKNFLKSLIIQRQTAMNNTWSDLVMYQIWC